jgi:hypothetical protein
MGLEFRSSRTEWFWPSIPHEVAVKSALVLQNSLTWLANWWYWQEASLPLRPFHRAAWVSSRHGRGLGDPRPNSSNIRVEHPNIPGSRAMTLAAVGNHESRHTGVGAMMLAAAAKSQGLHQLLRARLLAKCREASLQPVCLEPEVFYPLEPAAMSLWFSEL